jgi:hypothetical protein
MGTSNNKLDDAFFESMFEQDNLDQPSEKFTANVMQMVNKEALKKSEISQPIISYKYWALIGIAFVAAGYIIFGMELPSLGNLFGSIDLKSLQLTSFSGSIFKSISDGFASIQVPSILIIVTVAIISLIGLDRMLKKPVTTHLFVF